MASIQSPIYFCFLALQVSNYEGIVHSHWPSSLLVCTLLQNRRLRFKGERQLKRLWTLITTMSVKDPVKIHLSISHCSSVRNVYSIIHPLVNFWALSSYFLLHKLWQMCCALIWQDYFRGKAHGFRGNLDFLEGGHTNRRLANVRDPGVRVLLAGEWTGDL